MAHTNVQLVSGNLTTGGADPTFFIDRVNNKIGIGGVPDTSGDDSSNVLQVTGSMLATAYHGSGEYLTGIESSQWLHNAGDSSKIYYNGGNVGIGVTNPDNKLEVRGTIQASQSDEDHGMIIDKGGTVRRDYGGNGAGLHFTGNEIRPTNYAGAYSNGGIDLGNTSYRWNNVYTEALNASGTVTATSFSGGTVSATTGYFSSSLEADGRIYADNGCHVRGDWLRVNGNHGIYMESHGGGWNMTDTTYMRCYNNKVIYTAGAILAGGNVTAYSDIRRKKDLVKLDNALNKVEQLTGYTYTNKIDNKRYTGLIAQDVQKVLPEAVQTEKIDGHLSLAYGNMAGLFVEAIKELTRKNEILEARLNVIENNK
jgi:hypothetical protein